MIVRLVKMTFKEGAAEEFTQLFQNTKQKIRDFRGCIFLELLKDRANENIFVTYSVWSSEDDLNKYRDSELFKEIWPQVKLLFAAEPEVRSMDRIEKA